MGGGGRGGFQKGRGGSLKRGRGGGLQVRVPKDVGRGEEEGSEMNGGHQTGSPQKEGSQ